MSKEQKAYTPASATWEYTDMPLDYPMRTLGIQAQVGGEYSEHVRIMLTTSLAAYYITPGYNARLASSSLVASKVVQAQVAQGGKVNCQIEGAGQGQFQVNGSLPHQVLAIPFGSRDVIEDWYDVTKVGNLRLSLKGGSAATGTYRIITEQLRKY